MDPVTHFEIPFDDVEKGSKFYADVFGWKTDDVPGMDYTMAITTPVGADQMPAEPGAVNGGFFKRDAPTVGPMPVILVDDLDAAVERVEAHGGTITVPANDVGDMGRYARFKDPQGNLIGLWQSLQG